MTPDAAPLRTITGFRQDDEGHWVAELECGHSQHMRHQPPWQVRPWVLTDEGRKGFLGTPIPCPLCQAPVNPMLARLKYGSGFWNAWRREHPDLEIVLDGANLSGMILTGIDFANVSLRGAAMHATSLMNADLRGADLTGANLSEADLIGANLEGAILSGANLHEADLLGATLKDAVYAPEDLRGALHVPKPG